MLLHYDKLDWKLALYYHVQADTFLLSINDNAFLNYPFLAVIAPPGPQNIETGIIELN